VPRANLGHIKQDARGYGNGDGHEHEHGSEHASGAFPLAPLFLPWYSFMLGIHSLTWRVRYERNDDQQSSIKQFIGTDVYKSGLIAYLFHGCTGSCSASLILTSSAIRITKLVA